jgi:hypothetical protein
MKFSILSKLQTKIKEWQDGRFLKKHGCDSWEVYHHRFDPDIIRVSTRIKDFYHGYPYIYCFENHNHDVYYLDIAVDGTSMLSKWCKANCKDKFRFDFHRVMKAPSTGNEWAVNELGGGDYIFAAFKNERDYLMFLLRWT